MAFCKNCGTKLDDQAVICPKCGVPQTPLQSGTTDQGGFLWGLAGCCMPVVGLILYLVWKDTKPKTSKAAGVGALVGVGMVVVFYILIFALGIFGSIYS